MQKSNYTLLVIICFASIIALGAYSTTSLFHFSAANNLDSETTSKNSLSFSIDDDYPSLWKKVDSLTKDGLYRSAGEVVDSILQKSLAEKNVNEVVKSSIYKVKLGQYTEEKFLQKNITAIKKLITTSDFPQKQLLHSTVAELSFAYLSKNRYKIYSTSTHLDSLPEDMEEWSIAQHLSEIKRHYLESLGRSQLSKHIPIEEFQTTLNQGNLQKKLRPNLYDFLAFRAINYFKNSESSLTTFQRNNKLGNEYFFATDASFQNIKFNENDYKELVLFLFQKLEKINRSKQNKSALVHNQLERLNYLKGISTHMQKNKLYQNALEELLESNEELPISAEVANTLAKHVLNNSGNFLKKRQAKITDEMLAMLEKYSQLHPESYGASQCEYQIAQILSKSLNITTESAYSTQENVKFLVQFKNVSKVHFRLYKVDADTYYENHNNYRNKQLDWVTKNTLLTSWSEDLIDAKNLIAHSTEKHIAKQEKGFYVLVASANKDFSQTKNGLSFVPFWVTDISYSTKKGKDAQFIYVADRISGKPLENVLVTIKERKYNYRKRNYTYRTVAKEKTSEKGVAQYKTSKYKNMVLEFSHGNDNYAPHLYTYFYPNYEQKPSERVHFFTDRGIYRPGQDVYFKGIVFQSDKENSHVLEDKKKTVFLVDANYQRVDTLELTSNEYGSFSGRFTLPTSSLNGRFSIQTKNGNTAFRVEEYKRPKFEVEFPPIKKEYKLGETVTVEGLAKMYSGAPMDDAKVNYKITRNVHYPSWVYYRWNHIGQPKQEIIKNGTTTTEGGGKFTIFFDAEKDASTSNSYSPYYSYTIEAAITDISGETQTNTQFIYVGESSLQLSFNSPNKISLHEDEWFKIQANNLNGEAIPVNGTFSLCEIKKEKSFQHENLWNHIPDVENYSKEEYAKLFPHTKFPEKDTILLGKEVYSTKFNTRKMDSVSFFRASIPQGKYMVKVTAKDSFGVDVKFQKAITIVQPNSSKNHNIEPISILATKSVLEPGDTATIIVSSALKNATFLYQVCNKNGQKQSKIITLNEEQKVLSIPIREEDRGNLGVQFATVQNNRHFSNKTTILVPYSNRMINAHLTTFRNKLEPGSKETWSVKVTGPNKEAIAAEALISMYDASLDAFVSNNFSFPSLTPYLYQSAWQTNSFRTMYSQQITTDWNTFPHIKSRTFHSLNWWGYYLRGHYYNYRGGRLATESMVASRSRNIDASYDTDNVAELEEVSITEEDAEFAPRPAENSREEAKGDVVSGLLPARVAGYADSMDKSQIDNSPPVKIRKNLNETAFFKPQLRTNKDGEISFTFTVPEALTTWKLIGLAHTKDLRSASFMQEVVTQKELMIQPNLPRFFREGDKMEIRAKVSNIDSSSISGNATLKLKDPRTQEDITHRFHVVEKSTAFNLGQQESDVVIWELEIPEGISTVATEIVAMSSKHSDGQANVLPILNNRIMVTESLPLFSNVKGTKEYQMKRLTHPNSSSIQSHSLTLEYTSNPAWYAVQSLPYMMEYPYECAEQTFSRYYANALAQDIVLRNPKIEKVFAEWEENESDAFLAQLEKNQELKNLLLEETPWVLDAQNDAERKKRVAKLFKTAKLNRSLRKTLRKLEKMQVHSGAWPWFKGMPENRYITQHIVTGLGHLKQLDVKHAKTNVKLSRITKKAIAYLDDEIVDDYQFILRHYTKTEQENKHLSHYHIQFLYARSFFDNIKVSGSTQEAIDYFQGQAKKYWTSYGLMEQAMLALQASRSKQDEFAQKIVRSLEERAFHKEEFGMYWKENDASYYWYEAPIEAHAILMEAFQEVQGGAKQQNELKTWLLKQKQTTDWKTTKATAYACYALLHQGEDLLKNENNIQIQIGGEDLATLRPDLQKEVGSGYFKTKWNSEEIQPSLGNISITNSLDKTSWGALYYQYFENLNKIEKHASGLELKRELYRIRKTKEGDKLVRISAKNKLKIGDKIRVRIVLKSDRRMEYVHLKDMRAAGLEPTQVFSFYRWQNGLGYYQTTKDASTNFFFDKLPKGTFVFEYDLRASQVGTFSNGISTIQCMYAPEFTAHSAGIKLEIEE